jgi:CRISPR-associated exonuclease Cas4
MVQLEVTDVKQYTYCPRIVYYRYCLPTIRPTTYKMEAGIAAHDDETEREQRRSLRPYSLTTGERWFDVRLHSEELGIHGRLDMVVAVPDRADAKAELIPVEYKLSERAVGRHFKVQLAMYGLLLEAAWERPVRRGFIYLIPLRQAVAVAITPALRRQAHTQIAAMRTMVEQETMPDPPATRRPCVSCEFRRFCNDVV